MLPTVHNYEAEIEEGLCSSCGEAVAGAAGAWPWVVSCTRQLW